MALDGALPIWSSMIGVVIGYVMKFITDRLQEKRLAQREQDKRLSERQDRNMERRIDFQRSTLLALQDECMELSRSTGRTYHQDWEAKRDGGKWGVNKLSKELDENLRLNQQQTTVLASRVSDEEVRNLVRDIKNSAYLVTRGSTEHHSDEGMKQLSAALEMTNSRIGLLLREIDATQS